MIKVELKYWAVFVDNIHASLSHLIVIVFTLDIYVILDYGYGDAHIPGKGNGGACLSFSLSSALLSNHLFLLCLARYSVGFRGTLRFFCVPLPDNTSMVFLVYPARL